MAASPPNAQKRKLECNIDRDTYDNFVKACSRKGFAPQIIIEGMMKKYLQTGQI